jgi:hypothetical protein
MIDRLPLNSREATYALAAWQSVLGQLAGSLVDSHAPLFSHALALVLALFGASDVAARLVPALAGVGLALTPSLLTAMIGFRAALAAGVLIGVSPIAVALARVVDPATTAALIVMLLVASALRVATDRPGWVPWTLAGGIGLALASDPSVVLALAAAAIAALATWSPSWRARSEGTNPRLRVEPRPGFARWPLPADLRQSAPWAFGAGVAIIAATGLLMDLRGVGFPLGDLWGGAASMVTPVPFPGWNLLSLLAYAWPLLVLGLVGFAAGARGGYRPAMFLGQWCVLLLALAGAVGDQVVALALFPVGPAALLAGLAIARAPHEAAAYRLSAPTWAVVAVTAALAVGGVLMLAHTVAGGRAAAPIALIALLAVAAAVAVNWRRTVPAEERAPALIVLAALAVVAGTIPALSRLTFGGSPAGSEILVREETHPAFREVFRTLNILANGDPRRLLMVDMETPVVARWYGRGMDANAMSLNPILLRDAPPVGTSPAPSGWRTPWRTVAQLDRSDLHPLGLLEWMLSRTGLVKGKASDIIVAR